MTGCYFFVSDYDSDSIARNPKFQELAKNNWAQTKSDSESAKRNLAILKLIDNLEHRMNTEEDSEFSKYERHIMAKRDIKEQDR
jgi:hypothetical protein